MDVDVGVFGAQSEMFYRGLSEGGWDVGQTEDGGGVGEEVLLGLGDFEGLAPLQSYRCLGTINFNRIFSFDSFS